MLDDSDRIAIALQVLTKQHVLDGEALGSVLREHFDEHVVQRGIQRGIGVVCDAEVCAAWGEVPAVRQEAARSLLRAEAMQDLIGEG